MLDETLRVLGWIGAAQAALLAAALLARRASSTSDRWLGTGLGAAAIAAALISLSPRGRAAPALEAAEVVATLTAGPLFAGWIAHLAGRKVPGAARWLAYGPPLLWALAALAGADFAGDPLAIRWVIWLLFAWSGVAFAVAASRWRALGARAKSSIASGLGGILLLHLAQLARFAAPQTTPAHLVPATIGLLLLVVSFSALRAARLPIASGGRSDDDARAAELVAAFDRLMISERAFVEPGLQVHGVAARLGTNATALSRALNRHAGTSFSERLARARVDEAGRLLAEPAFDHLSVEALGARAGFGSRSAFFAEFRRRTGRSPAEFRQAALVGRAPAPAPSSTAKTS